MIKTRYRILIMLAIMLMVCFLMVGYAALTDRMSITGSANVEGKPFQGVYIKEVELIGTSNAVNTENEYVLPTNHKTTSDASRSAGTTTTRFTETADRVLRENAPKAY